MRAEDDDMINKGEVGMAHSITGTASGVPCANENDIFGSKDYRRAQRQK